MHPIYVYSMFSLQAPQSASMIHFMNIVLSLQLLHTVYTMPTQQALIMPGDA